MKNVVILDETDLKGFQGLNQFQDALIDYGTLDNQTFCSLIEWLTCVYHDYVEFILATNTYTLQKAEDRISYLKKYEAMDNEQTQN